jgi:hypothetical protein
VHARINDEDDVAAVTAITTVWATEGLELLPVDGGNPVAAVTGGDMDHHTVDESGHGGFLS